VHDKPLKIGLLWHSLRSDNLGVGALSLANLAIVQAAAARAGRTIDVLTIGFGGPLRYAPSSSAVHEHIIPSSRSLIPGGPLWRALGRCHMVLDISAGDSWADIYGAKRFIWQWASKEMALLQGRKLILSPQTIGPFTNLAARSAARTTMRRSHAVFTRDGESLAFLKEMRAAANALETVDVAFRLPFTPAERASGERRLRFGLNVSGLLYAGGYTQKGQFGSRDTYRSMVEGILTQLQRRGDVDVTLVPHVVPNNGSIEDDAAVSHAIAGRFPGVSVAPLFSSPIEAKSFIAGLDMLAGSRMHATIAAASAGVAVVPLAYSRKFRGVFQSIGYPIVGDCTTSGAAELVDLTVSALDRRAELAAAAKAGAGIALRRLAVYEDFLAEALASATTAGA
jgi:colanic acid/amylovoran biosynthesis protein